MSYVILQHSADSRYLWSVALKKRKKKLHALRNLSNATTECTVHSKLSNTMIT